MWMPHGTTQQWPSTIPSGHFLSLTLNNNNNNQNFASTWLFSKPAIAVYLSQPHHFFSPLHLVEGIPVNSAAPRAGTAVRALPAVPDPEPLIWALGLGTAWTHAGAFWHLQRQDPCHGWGMLRCWGARCSPRGHSPLPPALPRAEATVPLSLQVPFPSQVPL